MKIFILTAVAFFSASCLYAQNSEAEAEIRRLEQKEVEAILQKDSVTLLQLWDPDYLVNSPDNVIYYAGKTTLDRPVLKRARTSFVREVEHVSIKGTFAFSMGNETVVPVDGQQETGQIVKRRFTNIWEKQPAGWRLVGRHANIICNKN
jgi:ketosteroid isomerase-like protein